MTNIIEITGDTYENDNGKMRDRYDLIIDGGMDNPHLCELRIRKQNFENNPEDEFIVSVEDLYLAVLPYYMYLETARKDARGEKLTEDEEKLLSE